MYCETGWVRSCDLVSEADSGRGTCDTPSAAAGLQQLISGWERCVEVCAFLLLASIVKDTSQQRNAESSGVPQPSLPASQGWRYTLVTNEDTNNTPGRACRRPKPHKPSAPVDVRPIIDAVDGTVEQPGRRPPPKRFAARERRRAWDTPASRVWGPDPAPRRTLVAVEVFGPRAARLDPDSAQLPRGY